MLDSSTSNSLTDQGLIVGGADTGLHLPTRVDTRSTADDTVRSPLQAAIRPAVAVSASGASVCEIATDDIGDSHQRLASARDSFVSSVYLLLALTVIQKALGFVRSVIVCKTLSPEEMGIWSMTMTFMATFMPFLMLSIPACFGRYFEQFEQRNQLKTFVWQSVRLMAIVFPLGMLAIAVMSRELSKLIYGSSDFQYLVLLSLLFAVPFACFGVCESMLTALRKSKSKTIGDFLNGLSFTVLAIALIFLRSPTAISICLAFAAAYAVAAGYAYWHLRRTYRSIDGQNDLLLFGPTWRRLAPVILLFWLSDFVVNLFFAVDRYMIVSLSPEKYGPTLEQVGNYESAHIMPLLLSSVTGIIARILLPYLSRDWEADERERVGLRVTLSVKAAALVLIFGSLAFYAVSDLMFAGLFQNKYSLGKTILPYVVFFYVGNGLAFLIMNYFWCCEKGGYGTVALLAGLVVNVAANAMLIPWMGITGAAIGTAFAVVAQLACLYGLAIRFGLRFDFRVLLVTAVSGSLLLGEEWTILILVAAVVQAAFFTFSREEWRMMRGSLPSAGVR
jgi:O-antigen/teichoic acid export membrane protein